jgi:hypothetical protein
MAQQEKRDHKLQTEKMPPTLAPISSQPPLSGIEAFLQRKPTIIDEIEIKPLAKPEQFGSLFGNEIPAPRETVVPIIDRNRKTNINVDDFNKNAELLKTVNPHDSTTFDVRNPSILKQKQRDEHERRKQLVPESIIKKKILDQRVDENKEKNEIFEKQLEDEFNKSKLKQQSKTSQKRFLDNKIEEGKKHHSPVKQQFSKVTLGNDPAANRDVKPLFADDEPDGSNNPSLVQIGDFDDPEENEKGLAFKLPERLLIESYPFLSKIYNLITGISLIKSVFNSFYELSSTILNLNFASLTQRNMSILTVITIVRLYINFYLYFQTHYLQPQVMVYLVQTARTFDSVKRHEKNRLTAQTSKDFQEYEYEMMINLPIKHWFIRACTTGLRYLTPYMNQGLAYFGYGPIVVPKPPKEIKLPDFLRNLMMNRFYTVSHGQLKPKKIVVNTDLYQRIMTTKAINFHQPIEQQMKTITALVNNQSDINLSNREFVNSTVSDTLTLAKFQLLNKTSEIAEMGFEQASLILQRNMVIDTTRLQPSGGPLCHRNRKPILDYDPPEISQTGLTVFGLYSVTLVALSLLLVYLTRTSQIQLVPFLAKLKGQLSISQWLQRVHSRFKEDFSSFLPQLGAILQQTQQDSLQPSTRSNSTHTIHTLHLIDAIIALEDTHPLASKVAIVPAHGLLAIELLFITPFTLLFGGSRTGE